MRAAAAALRLSLLPIAATTGVASAGQASTQPFTVSVSLRNPVMDVGCSVLSRGPNVSVTCGPTALQPFAPATVLPATAGTAAYVRPSTASFRGGDLLPPITPELGDLRTRTGRELEGGTYLREDDDDFKSVFVNFVIEADEMWRLPLDFGQYSSRTILVGGREYVEMTVSW